MANQVVKFQWEKLLSRFSDPTVLKSINAIRNKGNEFNAVIAKESKPLPPLDFAGYKEKLKFTGVGVDALEPMLKSIKIPQYTSDVPDFEKKKREEMLKILNDATEATKSDLQELYKQREDFETNIRTNKNSTLVDIRQRFPDISRSDEDEIDQRLWFYNKEETRSHLEEAREDNEDAHCKNDGSKYAGDYGYKLSTGRIPAVKGEDSYVAKNTKHYVGFE
eukprot:CAMPEP_0185042946 /NCGR_PEP_ID=MMETSP1103-20130426/42633_1 /TAXON_ID=36769 /ORGANISM="Paraphysomonas bandaiensis, Strain Caron Lab Isolate" /LENGTH=220 /DNA_ID=CAMNT_0027583079 /DNA_START=68 /DNA_END=730 /DNA_ORIENTATION=-